MKKNQITFKCEGKSPINMNVLIGTMGEKNIDISKLKSYGYLSFDPSFSSTASCSSKISYIDGEKGILLYRGYSINQLVSKSNYLEVCYILLYGETPSKEEFSKFRENLFLNSLIHKDIVRLFDNISRDSHPMSIMCSIFSKLSSLYHDTVDISKIEQREFVTVFLLAKISNIVSMCYKHLLGQKFNYPNKNLSYASNFLHMMFSDSLKFYEINPIFERAMDKILILHADHEQNVSTSVVRSVASTGSNIFACILAGLSALWGPKHGGANEECIRMLKLIKESKNIPKFIKKAKDKNDPFKLMGFGHRVYKSYDPRAILMREVCYEILKELNSSNDLLNLAIELENVALNDDYFIERKLFPNIDFYSGIVLKTIGFPIKMFTVIFAMARLVGWIAHWKETNDDKLKIARPRQLYTGYSIRDFNSKI